MKLHSLISAITARSNSPHIAIQSTDRSWSYAQLNDCCQRFRQVLKQESLTAESNVAIIAQSSHETIALIVATASLGHVPLLISPTMGNDVKQKIYAQNNIPFELAAREQRCTVTMVATTQSEGIAEPSTGDPPTAALLTTSGTTGTPKVVRVAPQGLRNFVDWAIKHFAIDHRCRVLSYAPLNFDLSLFEVWATLASGATVLLTDPARATDPAHVGELVLDRHPTIVQAVPMFYRLLTEFADHQQLTKAATQPRHLISTGDTASPALRQHLAALFPTAAFHNIYGSTETNDSFIHSCTAADFAKPERLPIGRPIAGVHYRIVTAEGHEHHGSSAEGMLYTATPFMSNGYTDTRLNADSFLQHAADGRTYFRTGDRVRISENGEIQLLGRADFIVKVRGVRTNLMDVEAVLSRYPGVAQAAAIHRQDPTTDNSVHAVVQMRPGCAFVPLDIRRFCASQLPRTAIPSTFHSMERLPTTSTGKPDRRAISSLITTRKEHADRRKSTHLHRQRTDPG